MRRIIGGRIYDTAKADLIASWESPHNRGDFHWHCERLYRTSKGALFLHGEGGASSPWAEACPDGRGYGEDLRALDQDEAREWLERHGSADDYEKCFPDVEEA